MTDKTYTNRIVNGLLKADIGLRNPDEVAAQLSRNVVIRVDQTRAVESDLWPCVWFLASILEKQFFRNIFICGLESPLRSPVPLGSRCIFLGSGVAPDGMQIGVGLPVASGKGIWGDAKGNSIAYHRRLDGPTDATPLAGAILAGYLGFAALADSASIPPFHQTYVGDTLHLPLLRPTPTLPMEIAILGVGQIGQAFLALNFFIAAKECMTVHLVDDDHFEPDNYRTQLLLNEDQRLWNEKPKVDYIADLCTSWGWTVTREKTRITWGWRSSLSNESVVFLGFDNMEARRVGVEGGFKHIVECGVGTDFSRPHVSWHSLPADRELAKELFADHQAAAQTSTVDPDFLQELNSTPGGCGRVTFEGIHATAPCLGTVAAAYAWMELLNFTSGDERAISGSAFIWSPLLPLSRDVRMRGNPRATV